MSTIKIDICHDVENLPLSQLLTYFVFYLHVVYCMYVLSDSGIINIKMHNHYKKYCALISLFFVHVTR